MKQNQPTNHHLEVFDRVGGEVRPPPSPTMEGADLGSTSLEKPPQIQNHLLLFMFVKCALLFIFSYV